MHGHFYQPPRENPWLDMVEEESSADPWHDWNERITAECYAPNSWARIFSPQGWLEELVNNYGWISFDFGPTLFRWLERRAPDVCRAVLEGDRVAQERFSGHGSALAHPWVHAILPLLSREDKETLVHWGIRDFEYRFGRSPEGMWLPECAVDLETLDVLASSGIGFTILSPQQALRVKGRDGHWREVKGAKVDPFRAYRLRLPSGREMAVFFFHGALSHGISFGDLLRDGARMAQRMLEPLSGRDGLLHVATDGETFGHHRTFGEMALAYALREIERRKEVSLTVYGEFLERHPPEDEVEIIENTSWSCPHGLGRWQTDCGCSTGRHSGWSQGWRKPLRVAIDWLSAKLREAYGAEAEGLFQDPRRAREDYIEVLLDPSTKEAFLRRHASRDFSPSERTRCWQLLEMERQRLLMFTSCGWFFDDPSGLETVQVLKHAARAIDLAERALGLELEEGFLERLAEVKSNRPEVGDGRWIYEHWVRPQRVSIQRASAHLAMTSLLEGPREELGPFRVKERQQKVLETGRAKLALGWMKVQEGLTEELEELYFSTLHFGDHNLLCGISSGAPEGVERLQEAFSNGDLALAAALLKEGFPHLFTLASLTRDGQREVMDLLQEERLSRAQMLIEGIYEENAPMVRFLCDLGFPPPRILEAAAAVALEGRATRAVRELDPEGLEAVLEEARAEGIRLELGHLRHRFRLGLEALAEELVADPDDSEVAETLRRGVEVALRLGEVPLGKVQASILMAANRLHTRAQEDPRAEEAIKGLMVLAQLLKVSLGV